MALGPGKYDHLCTYVREQARAGGACVMVFEGAAGWGFSVQAPPIAMPDLARLLRHIADTMDQDVRKDLKDIVQRN
jgi:hypothetical protein